jgi:hypothetical protein
MKDNSDENINCICLNTSDSNVFISLALNYLPQHSSEEILNVVNVKSSLP